jgi:hypothetical protein
VSALVDGELPADERDLVVRHARGCPTCTALSTADRVVAGARSVAGVAAMAYGGIGPRMRTLVRIGLAAAGTALVVASTPDVVRGSTVGASLHDLRHLAIWQAAIGVAVVAAAATLRLSRLVLVLAGTFVVLTAAAGAYDAVTGHPGPWRDPTHVLEVVAAVLLLCLTWPYVRIGHTSRT